MKKTLIASAITAATLSTSAFAMDAATDLAEMLESMPSIYGNIQVAFTSEETNSGLTGAKDVSTNGVDDNGSTIGFTHEHAISEGVEGFLKAEFEFDADEDTAGIDQTDEFYVGVRGEFGSIQYGKDETVYDWTGMTDTAENAGIGGEISDDDQLENIQYVSPEIADGLVVGVTVPVESDATFAGALAAKYSADNLEVAFAYAMSRDEGLDDGSVDKGEDTIGLAAAYTMDDLTLIAQYETQSDTEDFIGVQGMYTMGQNVFALGYGMTSFDGSGLEDQSTIYLQALHNLSDHMYVYLEYVNDTDIEGDDGNDKDLLTVGATYAF
jgi:predicted porin